MGSFLCCLLAAFTRFTARKPPRARWLHALAHLCILVVLQGMVTAWLQDFNARLLPATRSREVPRVKFVILLLDRISEKFGRCPLFLLSRISEILREPRWAIDPGSLRV